MLLARSILLAPPELQPVEIAVIDPKSDTDFDFLDELPRFYRGEQAPQGLSEIFNSFRLRQNKIDNSRNLKIAFIDEFASLINLISDKKDKENALKHLSLLLMLSRSFRFSIHLATQQASAKTIGDSGNREQFGAVCLLGDSGAETLQMLFDGDSRECIKEFGSIGSCGVGWLSLNGGLAQPVRVPNVKDFDKLHTVIKRGVNQ